MRSKLATVVAVVRLSKGAVSSLPQMAMCNLAEMRGQGKEAATRSA